MTSDRRFEQSLEIRAPRDAVWEALATARGLERWFAPSSVVEPRVGGEVRWTWGEAHDWKQTVEVWEPGRRLVTRYDSPVEDGRGGLLPLFIEFELKGVDEGRTTLRVVHSGFGPESDFDQEFDGISQGWPIELESLRNQLEQHAGLERSLVWSVRPFDGEHEDAWTRLTGEGGFRGLAEAARTGGGGAFRITAPDGEVFTGESRVCGERFFTGVAHSHGNAFLRMAVEACGGTPQVWLWLATYGRPDAEAPALQASWDALLAGMFPAPGVGAASASSARAGA